MKNITVFYLKIKKFLEEKFSIYLNRRVFVMLAFQTTLSKDSDQTAHVGYESSYVLMSCPIFS